MDRVERKRRLSAILLDLHLPGTPCGMDYEALLKVLQVETSDERGILAAALVDNIFECRRHGDNSEPFLHFLTWLGGSLPE